MKRFTPMFHQLLASASTASETLTLEFSIEHGWSGENWLANLALSDLAPELVESSIGRRIEHYVSWCLSSTRRFVYAQHLFLSDRPGFVCARTLTFDPFSTVAVRVTIEPLGDYADVIFSSGLDQTLLNSIRDAIIVTEAEPVDLPGPRVVYANGVFERMSGYTQRDILGQTPRILQSEPTNAHARQVIRASLAAWQPIKIQMNNITLGGERFLVELDISPVKDITGWWTHWISVQRDVTQEMLNEAEQAKSRMILRNSGIGTWSYDLTTQHVSWDEQMYALFEIEPTTYGSDFEAWQRHLHPDDIDALKQAFKQALRGKRQLDDDFRIHTGTQATRYLHVRAEMRRDDQGWADSVDGVCLDVTPRRQYELEMDRQQQFAIHQDRLASIGELAAGVGHEVNNPLSIVIGFAEHLAKLNSERFNDADIAMGVDSILAASERIGNIVSGLRSFTHFGEEIESFSMNQALYDTTRLIRQIYQNEGVELTFPVNLEEDYVVEGNRGRVQQVLMNLLANAKDATEGLADRQITVDLQVEANQVKLSVKDNGRGISTQAQAKIFDAFFTTKAAGKGTGIGLSISQAIVHEHNGTLTFETSDKGTIFSIRLPLVVDASVPSGGEIVQDELISPRKLNVFVVDDEVAIRDLLTQALTRAGIAATAYAGARQALDALVTSSEVVDLIISDIRMPDMSGLALVTAVRLNRNIKQPRVLLITGGDKFEFSEVHGELDDLIDGVVYKPFRMREIVDRALLLTQKSVPRESI